VAYNFVPADRDQLMLMPPSVADWLPEDHLAWFVLDVVAELDLSAFCAVYRLDGRGGAAYDPQIMLAVLIYAYCTGERSSRRIEKRLIEDVAFRVVAANQRPDHATVARFRANHESAVAGLFGQALAVCARAGLLRPGLIAVDGTKLAAYASRDANRTATQIAEQILAEAAATDAAEDVAAVEAEEGEPVNTLRERNGRRVKLRKLLDELEGEAAEKSYESHMARRAEIEAATGKPIRGRARHRDRRGHEAPPGRRKWFAEHSRVGRRAVGRDLHRSGSCGEGVGEEGPYGLGVSTGRNEHVDVLAVLVDRPVEVAPVAGDLDISLVDELRRERLYPAVDGHAIHHDAPLGEQLFHVAVGRP
jgi:transposase